jgi:hypothetical protein
MSKPIINKSSYTLIDQSITKKPLTIEDLNQIQTY